MAEGGSFVPSSGGGARRNGAARIESAFSQESSLVCLREGRAVGMLSVLGIAVSSAVLVGYGVWTRRTGRVPRAPRRALASWMGVSEIGRAHV